MTAHTVLVGVLASAIGLLPLAPREHVHEVEAPDGHHQTVAHRHASSHLGGHDRTHDRESGRPHEAGDRAPSTHAAEESDARHHDADHTGTTHDDAIDHADSVITQIGAAFTLPQDGVAPVPTLEVSTLAPAPRAPTRAAHEPFVERLNHGPPATPTAPRPPPSATRL